MLCQKVALISNLMLHYRDKQAFGCPVWGYTGSLALVPVVSTWLPVAWRDPIRGWTLHKHEQLIIYNLQYIWHIYIYICHIYIIYIYMSDIYIWHILTYIWHMVLNLIISDILKDPRGVNIPWVFSELTELCRRERGAGPVALLSGALEVLDPAIGVDPMNIYKYQTGYIRIYIYMNI